MWTLRTQRNIWLFSETQKQTGVIRHPQNREYHLQIIQLNWIIGSTKNRYDWTSHRLSKLEDSPQELSGKTNKDTCMSLLVCGNHWPSGIGRRGFHLSVWTPMYRNCACATSRRFHLTLLFCKNTRFSFCSSWTRRYNELSEYNLVA